MFVLYQTSEVDSIVVRLKKWHMCHFFNPELIFLPLIILDETVENDVASFAKENFLKKYNQVK